MGGRKNIFLILCSASKSMVPMRAKFGVGLQDKGDVPSRRAAHGVFTKPARWDRFALPGSLSQCTPEGLGGFP